jgi:hypothetical protein
VQQNILEYQKVCHWFSWLLIDQHKRVSMEVSLQFFQWYAAEGKVTPFLIPLQNDKVWHYAALPEKTKTISSAAKIVGTVFWDAEVCTLVDFLSRKETVNAVHWIQML